MFFESSLWKLTEFILNGVPKLRSPPSKRNLVLFQSRCGLMEKLPEEENLCEKITNVSGKS